MESENEYVKLYWSNYSIRDLKGSDSEEYKYLKKLHEDFMKGRGNRKELYQEFQNWLKREVNVA